MPQSETRTPTDMVLGTSTSNEGWMERAKFLCNPDHWIVNVGYGMPMHDALTKEERERLQPKIQMVMDAARIMLAGMVKGTIKYPTDGFDIDKWMDHLIGEGCDQMNYQVLLANAWKQSKKPYGGFQDAVERGEKLMEAVKAKQV